MSPMVGEGNPLTSFVPDLSQHTANKGVNSGCCGAQVPPPEARLAKRKNVYFLSGQARPTCCRWEGEVLVSLLLAENKWLINKCYQQEG